VHGGGRQTEQPVGDSDTTTRKPAARPRPSRYGDSGEGEDAAFPAYGSADYIQELEAELDRNRSQIKELASLAKLEWVKIIFLGVIELIFIAALFFAIYASVFRHYDFGFYTPILNYMGVFLLFLLIEGLSIMSSSFTMIRKITHLLDRHSYAVRAGESELLKA
jgi:ABC-type multidrug transport system fused ATPase/permease subunit